MQAFDNAAVLMVQDVLIINMPTNAPAGMQGLYQDQVGTLNKIFNLDFGYSVHNLFIIALTFSSNHFQMLLKKDWFRKNAKCEQKQVITITFPYKYQVHSSALFTSSSCSSI